MDGGFAFLHDRVQEAVYALIPKMERAATHLRIGRVLAARTPPAELEEKIFEIVNQLDRGAALVDTIDEREQIAELNLRAGKRAKTSTAYASALIYLATGRKLLAEESWQQNYHLTFELEYHQAECEFLTGDLAAAEERLSMLSRRAANLVDLAAVTCRRIAVYTTLDRPDRAVEMGLEFLRHTGVTWSPHPTDKEAEQEFERIWHQLGSRPIEALLDLPQMSDPAWCATIEVLAEIIPPALFTDNNLHCLVIGRMANLSLEYGNSDGSCHSYGWVGMLLGPRFGDYPSGFRFGKLAVDLVEQRGLLRFKARAYLGFAYVISLDEAPARWPRIGAPRIRCGARNRRPYLCGLFVWRLDYAPACKRRSARSGTARSRERARICAENAIWCHRRYDPRTARLDPDASWLDAGFRISQRRRVRRAPV